MQFSIGECLEEQLNVNLGLKEPFLLFIVLFRTEILDEETGGNLLLPSTGSKERAKDTSRG